MKKLSLGDEVPEVESNLVDSGIILFKFWISVSREEVAAARMEMFNRTHTSFAPWTVIKSDDKKRARLNCIRYVLNHLPYYHKDNNVAVSPDPKILGVPKEIYKGIC